jgi:hypothetical protein
MGTILQGIVWLHKCKETKIEDAILDVLKNRAGRMPWQSAHGIVARMRHDAVFAYMPAVFPPRINSWSSFVTWLSVAPCQARYLYHRKMVIPSLQKANKTMRALWKRGLLTCLPDNPNLYQLRY